jgi:CDP-diacylglycerol--glycerol-3-phosphate 3-phosphatidyltransferase
MAGFLMAAASGVAVAGGKMGLGGWLFLLSGPFDALDGALARTAGLESRFGAFLDSFLDRYADAAVVIGIIYWASRHGRHGLVAVSALALLGSVMVSYARARAEGLGISCSVGLFTRLERFALLVMTLFSGQLLIGVGLLAVLSNITAVQRLYHVYTHGRPA